jgi:hypothetical protein
MNAEVSLDGNLAWLQDEIRANRARLPQQLINARRWLLWEEVPDADPTKKARKVPYYVNGTKRQGTLDTPDDTARLATFDEAIDALWQGDRDYAGLGFALGPDDTGNYWQGFDADNITPEQAQAFIDGHDDQGYAEVSPSGRGVHVIGYGQHFPSLGSNGTGVEAYAAGRFFTFTGDRGRGVPTCIAAFVNGPVAERHRKHAATASAAGMALVDAKTVSELRSALLHMRSDDYDTWYRMGLALKELGDVGRGLWMEWSATSTKFDVQEASRKWEQLGMPRDTDYRAVFAEATRRGWVNPASNAAQFNAATQAPAQGDYSFARGRGGEAIVETQYLIDPWLPRSTVIGFYGRGEAGKTSFVAQMVGAASRQVSTLWISSEERKDHILKRHEKCAGRMDALAVLETVPTKIDEKTKKPIATSFNIFEHMEGAMLAYQRDPATPIDRPLGVVVLDAVVALVTWEKGTNANDDGGVKKLIAHLVTLAEKYGVTFIMLGHLNKRTGHDHIADAVTGAAAWTNSVRLAFLLQKNLESDDYEGFIRTAKTNTGTHFGATYKTVARHVLKVRDDGKPDVLCGIDLVTDVVWGEQALREMMATDEESERWLNKREKKAQTVHMLVEIVLNTLRSISTTNRKSVELALPPGEKVSRRHWVEADKILAARGVQIVNLERGQFGYSLVQQPK